MQRLSQVNIGRRKDQGVVSDPRDRQKHLHWHLPIPAITVCLLPLCHTAF